jgi:hypothetical protein
MGWRMAKSPAQMYREHHTDKADERLGLFRGLVEHFGVTDALYPGSFVHVTPSFVIPRVVYVDSDRRAQVFFEDPRVLELVDERREYEARPSIGFHRSDYAEPFDEPDSSFDLLISQYAGFVSRACKRYLKIGGLLVANNSHGDASMARLDPSYRLVAVCRRRSERFTFAFDELETYMVPKAGAEPTLESLEQSMRGPAFTRSVGGYVFEKTA